MRDRDVNATAPIPRALRRRRVRVVVGPLWAVRSLVRNYPLKQVRLTRLWTTDYSAKFAKE